MLIANPQKYPSKSGTAAPSSPRVYHAPYYARFDVTRPIKVYVQQVEAVQGNAVPFNPDQAKMGEYAVWFSEEVFDAALAKTNKEFGGKITLGKGTEVLQGGTTLWQIMAWSDKFQKYLPDERNGVYRKKEFAEERCRADYTLHKEFLSFASHGKIDSLLPPAAVDFSVPNAFKEIHIGL